MNFKRGIGLRLFAFNLLLLFLPVAGILYLDVYEEQLLGSQERSMVQQARLVAAAMAAAPAFDEASATALLRTVERAEARIRVYDSAGALLADSNRFGVADTATAMSKAYPAAPDSTRARVLYRLGAWLARARAGVTRWTQRLLVTRQAPGPVDAAAGDVSREIASALQGRYGAATRPTPGQRSLTLSSAVPVRRDGRVAGAVLVSQSTFRVLQALYDVRLRIFEVVLGSVVAAALLTAVGAATVVRPLRRLRREATSLAERRDRLPGRFIDTTRRDELGDLARALQELTRRLDEHIRDAERFASDVSHEFRNPLASIRAAAEMTSQSDDPSERTRFLAMLTRDVDRLEGLVSGVRELARIDSQLQQEPLESVNPASLVSEVIDGLRLAYGSRPEIVLQIQGTRCVVRAGALRLVQALENVLVNARSVAPPDSRIEVSVRASDGRCAIEVADRGPGIPPAHLERLFERFFSYRPAEAAGAAPHAGLGLAIARSIVQGYGGTIAARNRDGGGAVFEIRLPCESAALHNAVQQDRHPLRL
jgi:two-component system sensor histidine kinase ChvG